MMHDDPDNKEQHKGHGDDEQNPQPPSPPEALGGKFIQVETPVPGRHEYAPRCHATENPSWRQPMSFGNLAVAGLVAPASANRRISRFCFRMIAALLIVDRRV